MLEPKYQLHVDLGQCDKVVLISRDWTIVGDGDGLRSPVFDTWDVAMAKAVELGLGRSTSEAGTFELDPGVGIKAVKE